MKNRLDETNKMRSMMGLKLLKEQDGKLTYLTEEEQEMSKEIESELENMEKPAPKTIQKIESFVEKFGNLTKTMKLKLKDLGQEFLNKHPKVKEIFNKSDNPDYPDNVNKNTESGDEKKVKLPFIKFVTKYKDGLKGFIETLNNVVQDEEEFCKNPKEATKDAAESLKDFISRIALDAKTTDENALKALYDKGNSGLIKTVISIAKPLVNAFGGGALLSKEMLDEIENHMRAEYGQVGRGINNMLLDIFSKLNITVGNICKK